ncbi:MAG: hypothetical protein JKY89_06670 [Immundisolibacteraceae bacterium]|nr:hypothetical protein [Immundisolibacteraceae bacterium]
MITFFSMVPDFINSHAMAVVYVTWLIAATGSLVTVMEARKAKKIECGNRPECCH